MKKVWWKNAEDCEMDELEWTHWNELLNAKAIQFFSAIGILLSNDSACFHSVSVLTTMYWKCVFFLLFWKHKMKSTIISYPGYSNRTHLLLQNNHTVIRSDTAEESSWTLMDDLKVGRRMNVGLCTKYHFLFAAIRRHCFFFLWSSELPLRAERTGLVINWYGFSEKKKNVST